MTIFDHVTIAYMYLIYNKQFYWPLNTGASHKMNISEVQNEFTMHYQNHFSIIRMQNKLRE